MTEWNPDNPADLGIWDDLGWTQPPPKKKAKSLKLKKKDTEHHFAETDGPFSESFKGSRELPGTVLPKEYGRVDEVGAEEF